MRFVLANGIRSHGEGNIDVLGRHLERLGYEVVDPRLPWRSVVTARWAARCDAEILIDAAEPGDVLIGHSFGALRALCAAEQLPDLGGVVLFGAAVERDIDLSRIDESIFIFNVHNPHDQVLLLGSFLICHPFGLGGRDGLKHWRAINVCQPHRDSFSKSHNSYFHREISQSAAVAECAADLASGAYEEREVDLDEF